MSFFAEVVFRNELFPPRWLKRASSWESLLYILAFVVLQAFISDPHSLDSGMRRFFETEPTDSSVMESVNSSSAKEPMSRFTHHSYCLTWSCGKQLATRQKLHHCYKQQCAIIRILVMCSRQVINIRENIQSTLRRVRVRDRGGEKRWAREQRTVSEREEQGKAKKGSVMDEM